MSSRSCCRVGVVVPLLCALLVAVGTALWVAQSYAASSSIRRTLAAASISTRVADYLLGLLGTVRTVVLVLAVVTAAVALLLTLVKARRRGRPGRAAGRADGAAASLTWLLMLGAVALVGLYTTLLLASVAADMLLSTATQYSNTAEKAVNRAVASSNSLVDQLKAVQLVAMDAAPADVQASQWFQEFRTGIINFNQTVSLAAGTPASSPCQPGCISLDFLAGLAGLDTTCLCIQNTITAVQQNLQSTKQATLLCLVGILLVYLAASWLIVAFTASCVNAGRDAREHRRLVKCSSTGEGLHTSSTSSYGSSGGLPPGADAAIDIRSDSSIAAYKAAQRPVVHHKPSVVQQQPARASGQDVPARDNNRAQRLPYV